MSKARLQFDGDNVGIKKDARAYGLTQTVEDKLASIDTVETTLQGEIDNLQDQINALAARGRYLSTWDCETGLPNTNPPVDPYTYRAGDYYVVSNVVSNPSQDNLRPSGSEYHAGVASQVTEPNTVSQNDLYIYDGTVWVLQHNGQGATIVWGSITGNLPAQADLQNALDSKVNTSDINVKGFTLASTTDYATGQEIWNWIVDGNTAIVRLGDRTYILVSKTTRGSTGNLAYLVFSSETYSTYMPEGPGGGEIGYVGEYILEIGNHSGDGHTVDSIRERVSGENFLATGRSSSFVPTQDGHPTTKRYVDNNDTYIGSSAPANNVVEGRLWYDTTNDQLKVYDGTQWNETGVSYVAGDNIQINGTTISATDTKYTAGRNISIDGTTVNARDTEYTAGSNVTIVCPTESDMKGPCPSGFHIPTLNEFSDLISTLVTTFGLAQNKTTPETYLKMPTCGTRSYSNSVIYDVGVVSHYAISERSGPSVWCNELRAESTNFYINSAAQGFGFSIRPVKNSPEIPDNSWTILYDGSSVATGAGIFHNSTLGLISISGDGINWITIADKNLGATTVYNSGDALSDANCGGFFQRGNNHMFPRSGTVPTSSVGVSTVGYGPGNYYSGATFITGWYTWISDDYSTTYNLRGGVTQGTWQDCEHPIISTEDTTYTAGGHIDITNNVISTTGLQEELRAGDNITIRQFCHLKSQGPCPDGFHIATTAERTIIRDIGNGNISPKFKMPLAGYRDEYGSKTSTGSSIGFWSSTIDGDKTYEQVLGSGYRALAMPRSRGYFIRPFKDDPVTPDSSWEELYSYSTNIVKRNGTLGLISASQDNGTTWITMADKNLGATQTYENGDTLSADNCGYTYQRGNNYGFPRDGTVTRTDTKVDASAYGPLNPYSSSTYIYGATGWDSSNNPRLWGGDDPTGTWCEPIISADANTKTFYLSSTSDLTTGQSILDWLAAGNNAIIMYGGEVYGLYYNGSYKMFCGIETSSLIYNAEGVNRINRSTIRINFDGNTGVISDIIETTHEVAEYLKTDVNYSTPYTPQYNGSPATKKYVDEHGANIPVYYYLGDFNSNITFNIIEAGVYRIYVRAYNGATVDKTLTLTVDGVAVGVLTSNLIENLNASINFTASAGSTAVLSVSSKTNFTIQEVYIEKVNIQSGYLTATVN